MQEAFVKAYGALGPVPRRRAVPAVAAAHRRERDPQPAPGRGPAARPGSVGVGADRAVAARGGRRRPASAALSGERRAELVRALAGCSDAHRQVVTCRYLLDLDEAETAAVAGLAARHGEVPAAPRAGPAGRRALRRRPSGRRRPCLRREHPRGAVDALVDDLLALGRTVPGRRRRGGFATAVLERVARCRLRPGAEPGPRHRRAPRPRRRVAAGRRPPSVWPFSSRSPLRRRCVPPSPTGSASPVCGCDRGAGPAASTAPAPPPADGRDDPGQAGGWWPSSPSCPRRSGTRTAWRCRTTGACCR